MERPWVGCEETEEREDRDDEGVKLLLGGELYPDAAVAELDAGW